MISLLLGIFGKDRLSPTVRKALLALGLTTVSYRLYKVFLAYQEKKKLDEEIAALEAEEALLVSQPPPESPNKTEEAGQGLTSSVPSESA